MGYSAWKCGAALSAVVLASFCVLIWKKKRRTYVKVGRVAKLYFYPVKSLKGIEVSEGYCTQFGLKVNDRLDRCFMLINADNFVESQFSEPRLALLSAHVKENTIVISGPHAADLKVEIRNTVSPEDKLLDCQVYDDIVKGVDCGDEAASWFQAFLGKPGVRLVHYFETLPRKYTKKDPFFRSIRENHPAGFQNAAAFHVLAQASLDDLNSKLPEKKVSAFNFRPNILVEGCLPFEDDSWICLKIGSGAEMLQLFPTGRCLSTTNDPETGVQSQNEPLTTLRKYRFPKDPAMVKKVKARPCIGTTWVVLHPGEIKVGDDIYAVIGKRPPMQEK